MKGSAAQAGLNNAVSKELRPEYPSRIFGKLSTYALVGR